MPNLVAEPLFDLSSMFFRESESFVLIHTSVHFTRRFEHFRINPDSLNVKIHTKTRTLTTKIVFTLRQKKGVNAIVWNTILVHLCVRK